jgi:hypothetical protein
LRVTAADMLCDHFAGIRHLRLHIMSDFDRRAALMPLPSIDPDLREDLMGYCDSFLSICPPLQSPAVFRDFSSIAPDTHAAIAGLSFGINAVRNCSKKSSDRINNPKFHGDHNQHFATSRQTLNIF